MDLREIEWENVGINDRLLWKR